MKLQLYFASEKIRGTEKFGISQGELVPRVVQVNTPIILDEWFRPLHPWNQFLRLYSYNLSANSRKAYGRDLFAFAEYLSRHSISLVEVNNEVLVRYRDFRFSQGLGNRSWRRAAVVIKAFFEFLVETSYIEATPWIQIGRFSVLSPRNITYDMRIRALTVGQWHRFKKVGLAGQLPSGEIDYSYRSRTSQRATAAAELAITTGMRAREWSTLLVPELQKKDGGSGFIQLEVAAKGERPRAVFVPEKTMSELDLYIRVERARIVRGAQDSLKRGVKSLAVVNSFNSVTKKVSYVYQDETHSMPLERVPIGHRRKLVLYQDGFVEPVSLFIGLNGIQPTTAAWNTVFDRANKRVAQFFDDAQQVTPHDLRHTFAVVVLKKLQHKAADTSRHQHSGLGGVSEHIIHNPLLAVQRLLGHASPETTMQYLRYIEDTDRLVQEAFDEWNDPLKDYSDYLLEELGITND